MILTFTNKRIFKYLSDQTPHTPKNEINPLYHNRKKVMNKSDLLLIVYEYTITESIICGTRLLLRALT